MPFRSRPSAETSSSTKPISHFSLVLTGSILSTVRAAELATTYGREPGPGPDAECAAADSWSGMGRRATLGGAAGRCADDLARLDDVLRWNVHDGMIHYTTPHGLEQSSGAAMGLSLI